MRRALTLIELLLALSLLASLTVAISTWLAMTTRAYAEHAAPTRWAAAADAALALVHEDLTNGDFDPDRRRVEVDQDLLRIQTRSPERYEYRLTGDELVRAETSGPRDERVLLDGVALWECQLDGEAGVLTVRIGSSHGLEVMRVLELP